jgi:uroporphyrin-III C-methyltransferase/precorrin-2 dehydrogenase/sirohydrochlorin ferrochelatase
MKYLPLFADIAGRHCLLIGGNETAAQKLRLLLRAGARPVVLARHATEEIAEAARQGHIRLERRGFLGSDLEGASLVIVADAPQSDAEAVSQAARDAGVLVNVVDKPDLCTVVVPGIVDRDPVLVAIGSAGASPVLVRRVRELIERALPPRLGDLARFAGRFRSAAARKIETATARRAFWERVVDGPIGALVLRGQTARANEAMLRLINGPAGEAPGQGRVALVGAGPGAADLLTLRALRLIQDADVVVHDALVSDEILDLVRRDAERINVGKRRKNHRRSQAEINELLAEKAGAGHRVVRLKGGDPFLFGRGGEELAYLKARGIEVEVVPGITAALGAAASAEIPLTHRDHASSVTFVTGHGADDENGLDETALANPHATAVVYMGLHRAGLIAERAIAGGRSPSTPVAVIDRATQREERVLRGTLAGLGSMVATAGLKGPALLVIGEVTALGTRELAYPPLRQAAG